ncbi:hypothetical protein A1O7_06880 [Cladophialophora yegresii CBS 114405]|uniref:Uncharacterized protein n=1 Tax=Cladophialophora yegresii CBS 114405 TaxID=1182544 RepID=W9VWD8_9EURO|nr:uncharacterized protein A1O7_06880 [Cladophialophora yegresii CBS 114405]EXJ56536.1 hypothetical protein A1O7_06880 [Cladophialophora yegresii CBS 114405]
MSTSYDYNTSRPLTLMTLPAEIRVQIWEYAIPQRWWYFAGPYRFDCDKHKKCPNALKEANPSNRGGLSDPRCRCEFVKQHNDRVSLSLLCKRAFPEIRSVLSKASITYETHHLMNSHLPSICFGQIGDFIIPSDWLACCGPKSHFDKLNVDFKTSFPNLKRIYLKPDLTDSRSTINFSDAIIDHIHRCLYDRSGRYRADDNVELLGSVHLQHLNNGYTEQFYETVAMLLDSNIAVHAPYTYRLQVTERQGCRASLRRPRIVAPKILLNQRIHTNVIWDKSGVRVAETPNLKDEWWYDEWVAATPCPRNMWYDSRCHDFGHSGWRVQTLGPGDIMRTTAHWAARPRSDEPRFEVGVIREYKEVYHGHPLLALGS